MTSISQSQIDDEISQGYKPHAICSGLATFPLNELADREFEMLVYALLDANIQLNEYGIFDKIVLMKGVGERGRDCLLYHQGTVSGLVQCKKLQKKMSRPEVLEEITKFLMFALSDEALMPSPEGFEYHLYASGGFFEPATTLLSSFNTESKADIESGRILNIIQSLKEKYATFKAYDNQYTLTYVTQALSAMTVKSFTGTELNLSLARHPLIISKFFRTMPILDPATFEEILDQKLEASGIKFLTNDNLNDLYRRISSIQPEFQLALGNIDLFGYSENFFKFLGKQGYSDLLKKALDVRSFLDLKVIEYSASLIMPEMVEKLTKPYVHTGIIIPFTLSVVSQYLIRRTLPNAMSKSSPKSTHEKMHPQSSVTKQDLMDSILEHCLESSRRFFAGDYSAFPNPDPDRDKRIALFKGMYAGCSNDTQLKEHFMKDITLIMPIVDNIELTISTAVPQVRTVVINDSAFFDDKEKFKRIIETIQGIG